MTEEKRDHRQGLRLDALDATPVMQARKTLAQHDQKDAVALMDRSLQSVSRLPTIVVAGEVKRGKSMLVNALAGAALSPTSPDTPSLAVVSVEPATPDLPLGWAEVARASGTERMPLETALTLLHPDTAQEESPLLARVAHASRWLPDAVLLDTPGVGGLDSVQGTRTALAATQADAVVLVTDGGQPITATELRFLQEISEHVEHVVLVLARIDRNPTSWEEIRQENRRILATYAPRFAGYELHPVSAALAMHALAQEGDLAAQLEQASQIQRLATALREVVVDRQRLAVANALRVGHTGLDRLTASVDLEIRALSDPAIPAALEAEQARLVELQLQRRRGKMDLERDLGRIRQAALRRINDASDELMARMSAVIAKEKRGMKGRVRDQFAANLLAELQVLAADVDTFTVERVTELVTRLLGDIEAAPLVLESVGVEREIDLRVRTRPSFAMNPLFDPSLAGAAFMGMNAAKLAAGSSVGISLGLPTGGLSVVGGGAMVALSVLYKNARQGQQELASTLFETLAGARQELVAAVDAWLRELRPELHIALEDHVSVSITTVRGVIEASNHAAKADAATRIKSLEQAVRRREALALRRDAVQARLLEISSGSQEQTLPTGTPRSTEQGTVGQEPDPQPEEKP